MSQFRIDVGMTEADLNILAEAIAFALVATIGGIMVYAMAFELRSAVSRRMLTAALPAAALVAVALAGTAVWPLAREGVNEAVGVRLDDEGQAIVSAGVLELNGLPTPGFAGSSGTAHSAREALMLLDDNLC